MADALPDDWSPPRRLDGYELLREIGRGGMGVVCLARQVALDRTVAVKVLHPRWARDAQLVARFTREAMAAARLTHPNIVQIHDIGMAAGQYYFSMEYVGGRTLADLLAREGRLAPREAAGYVLQAARGLACAHRNGIIHRDVKPGNLVLNDEGLCKVADLGLVKTSDPDPGGEAVPPGANPGLTRAGARMGTPLYMAPEQADPKARVDARTDIYALGCTLYHLLAGRPAHGGEDTTQILNRHRAGRPTPPRLLQPDVPEDLQRIVLGMIERDPAKRQASMEEVVRALEGFLRERAARGYEPSEAERRTVETAARDFRRSQWPTVEAWLGRILPGAAGTLTALALLLGDLYLAGIFLGLLALPPAALFLVRGLGSGTPAFSAFRQLLWTNRPADWGVIAVGVLLGLGLLGLVGLLGAWAGIALLSLLAALVYHLTIDAAIREEQAPVLDRVQAMLRRSRSRGAGEEDLRRFVWTHAGPGGEPFYEALFGYPALREARAVWGSGPRGGLPVQSRRLREAFVRWAERWTGERQAEALESHLRAVTDRAEPGPPDAAPPKPRMEPRGTDPHGADGADDGGIPPSRPSRPARRRPPPERRTPTGGRCPPRGGRPWPERRLPGPPGPPDRPLHRGSTSRA